MVLLLLAAVGSYAATCLGFADWLKLTLTCDPQGLWEVAVAFILALIANQGVYSATRYMR